MQTAKHDTATAMLDGSLIALWFVRLKSSSSLIFDHEAFLLRTFGLSMRTAADFRSGSVEV